MTGDRYALAMEVAEQIAAVRPDYTVARAVDLVTWDGLRLVPSDEYPIPPELDEALMVYAVSFDAEWGLVAITVRTRWAWAKELLADTGLARLVEGMSNEGDHVRTLIYDADYPVLVR